MNAFTFSEQRRIAKQDQADDNRVRAQKSLYDDFMKAAIKGDMWSVATFAPMTTDFKALYVEGFTRPMRVQFVGEIMEEALSYGEPTLSEAMTYLSQLAFTQQNSDLLSGLSLSLFERMGWRWAEMNVDTQL